MSYGQGDVVVASDPFGHAPRRPYLVVSNASRPFQGEDYLVSGITTTRREGAIPLEDEFDAGGLDRESYVSPWTVLTIRGDHVSKRVAVVSDQVVADTARSITSYVEPE